MIRQTSAKCNNAICKAFMEQESPALIKKKILEIVSSSQNNLLHQHANFCVPLLWQAIFMQQPLETVKLLVQYGADVNQRLEKHRELKGVRIIEVLANSNRKTGKISDLKYAELLVQCGADINADYSVQDFSALYYALVQNNLKFVEFLLSKGADLTGPEWARESPLIYACKSNHANFLVPLMIEAGADVDTMGLFYQNPLHYLCTNKFTKNTAQLAELLIERGCPFDDPNYHQETPLHKAAQHGDIELIELLVLKGADLQAKTAEGWTPLHIACLYHREKVIRLFLEYDDADLINIPNNGGKCPLSMMEPEKWHQSFNSQLAPIITMTRHIALQQYRNRKISDDNMELINSLEMIRKHYDYCLAELNVMENTVIYDNFSCLDVLDWPRNRDRLIALTEESDKFLLVYKKHIRSRTFPCYKVDMEYIMGRAMELRKIFFPAS